MGDFAMMQAAAAAGAAAARQGPAGFGGGFGGGGGFAQSSFVVVPGEVLEIRVGGAGTLGRGGWNGGGDSGSYSAGECP